MLEIKNLKVKIDNKIILNNFNLKIEDGQVCAIMGPNGVGKSTLSRVILGDNKYKILEGEIIYNNNKLNKMPTDKRAKLGIFLAMQYPATIEGVSNQDFLKTAMSSMYDKHIGLYDFILQCEKASSELKIDKSLIQRNLNDGFSGGEKKKNEILQMKLLKPSLIILDEIDSGLDVDSLKIVFNNIKTYLEENPKTSVLIISHYPMLFDYLKPDTVNILSEGKIVKTGDYKLAQDIFKNGYNKYIKVLTDRKENE